MNKTILLGMPNHYEIYRCMVKNLAFHRFHVINAVAPSKFIYPSLWLQLKTQYQKLILGNKSAKQELRQKVEKANMFARLEANPAPDWALFIRGDLYPRDFLEAVSALAKNGSINYQWDGMDRYPEIRRIRGCFDRFYVFDPKDAQPAEGILPTTNFYFDYPIEPAEEASDFYFIGADLIDRRPVIAQFGRLAEAKRWKLNFNINLKDKESRQNAPKIYPDNIRLLKRAHDFESNIRQAKASKVLVDFVNSHHAGLSFRVFEALGYRKKLITTNEQIARYDFYHPDNIFIWNGTDLDGIEAFFERPYAEIDERIREKYSFGNWIRHMLHIEPYHQIGLPEQHGR